MANNYVSLDRLSHFLLQLKLLIPKKTSDLTNDSNYVSDAKYVHTDNNYLTADKDKLTGIEEGANKYVLPKATAKTLGGIKVGANLSVDADGVVSASAMEWTNINGRPTKLSEFLNDENFIDATVSSLANYYTKTDTFTKTEVRELIGSIKTIQFEVVEALPSSGESNVIYLVSNGGADPNAYDEYAWIVSNNKFEKIGSTSIDLSNYWTKTDLVECSNSDIEALFN